MMVRNLDLVLGDCCMPDEAGRMAASPRGGETSILAAGSASGIFSRLIGNEDLGIRAVNSTCSFAPSGTLGDCLLKMAL
jgi:hypothetical protein